MKRSLLLGAGALLIAMAVYLIVTDFLPRSNTAEGSSAVVPTVPNRDTNDAQNIQTALFHATCSIAKERRLVVFTDDAPTYESRVFELVRRFNGASRGDISQTVSVVLTDPKNNLDARPVLQQLADEGGGFFSASSGSFIGKLLLALLEN
jgi:hypothetical protein